MNIKVILLAIAIVAIAFAAIAIKMFFIKGAEFKKSCGSVDASGKPVPCSCKSEGAGEQGVCENSSDK
ncbi:MAG: hypothetical protein R6V49_00335 [Bacteroidales bacterium]